MTFTAVVISHNNPDGLWHILGELRYQTRPPDETLVFYSCMEGIARFQEKFPEATYFYDLDKEDWGHHKRMEGLRQANSEFMGFFNDDDSYSTDYIEKMMAKTDENDVVFCSWNEQPNCGFALGSSTAGNFIFRTAMGRNAGYECIGYESDGHFIERLRNQARQIAKIEEILYFHNQGVRTNG